MVSVELYEAVCSRGDMRMHVPVIRHRGQWFNANTGAIETWVYSAEPMAGDRARAFLAIAEKTLEKLR